MNITIDGKQYSIASGEKLFAALKAAGEKTSSVLAALYNGTAVDLSYEPTADGVVSWIRIGTPEGLDLLRHSVSHIMALAVKRVRKDVKVTIGPSVKDGFYYDFDTTPAFTAEDLVGIEAAMKAIVKESLKFVRKEMSRNDAIDYFTKLGEPYKVEIIRDIDAPTVSLYELGEFTDLCRGPHIPHAGLVKAYKLQSVAGAYWRGSEKNKMLSRIYGTAFPAREDLDAYLKRIEAAKERDHRRIGKEMDIFSFHDEGQGFPFLHSKGMIIWNELITYWREEHAKAGYQEVKTPVILNRALWTTSGHWDNYRENMYTTVIDEEEHAIKPMNCPGGMLLFKQGMHSYRDLPLRVGEIGLVHRHEKSGVLSGLFRVRAFHQDDAHIFMREEHITSEILGVLTLIAAMYGTFGLTFHLELSTRPAKSIGSDEAWAMSEKALTEALKASGREYKVNPGDGAFYGPKIDVHIEDAIGRTWQCGTIQLDMNLPERFDLSYIAEDAKKHRPVMIHRVIYGSMERFLGILIEHFNGKFPLWLAPEQLVVMTVGNTDAQKAFGDELFRELFALGIRVRRDESNDTLGAKIRNARLQRIPYMVIIGDREAQTGTVTLRKRAGDEIKDLTPEGLIDGLRKEIRERMKDSNFEGVR
ncbi:MAG: threonine--tRNA ligase [Spirochaetota bacterium]